MTTPPDPARPKTPAKRTPNLHSIRVTNLPTATVDALELRAKAKGITRDKLIQEIIHGWLAHQHNPFG